MNPLASTLAALFGLFAAAASASSTEWPSAWRIYTDEPGLYRVPFEALRADAQSLPDIPTAELSLESRGRLVPIHVEDGADGHFGPGDWFEFAAEVLPGAETYYHPHSRHNVYRLSLAADAARRLRSMATTDRSTDPFAPLRRLHLERDQLLIRLAAQDASKELEPELWYWAKLTHLADEPFAIDLEMADAEPDLPASLAVGLRGLSQLPADPSREKHIRDHQVQVSLDGRTLLSPSWSGRQPFVAERSRVAWPEDGGDVRRLELGVPRRDIEGEPVIDVVMLDWVELTYGHNGLVGEDQVELHVPPEVHGGVVELRSPVARELVVAGQRSGYLRLAVGEGESVRVSLADGESSFWVSPADRILDPVSVESDRLSDLRSYHHQADYLIVSHGSLIDAAEDVAALHRQRGLTVQVIDVQDVYDEFGHGIVSPEAIRGFLAHAYHNWRQPRPRFVLLVGDASWDTKNATVDDANYSNWVGRQLLRGDRFVAKKTDDYDAARRNDRNLIPSWNYHTAEGHAASDAYYTLLDGDDDLPDIALGRFPVVRPDEVRAVAAKTRRYIERAPLGPWRSRLTWISGGMPPHQRRSTELARSFAGRGLAPTMILPGPKASMEDRDRIVESFGAGHLVTHFIGHGGRFIWRTGPPDLKDQVDLFGLEDLERLEPADALPIVLSVSCYSAPFDHPSADSIGEAFLRLPDRGAVAFIGASWRNAPPRIFSQVLVDELSSPGTVGEALMRTKRQMRKLDAIHLFNLLGDPAAPIAAPQRLLDVQHRVTDGVLRLTSELPASVVGGMAQVEFFDGDGNPLGSARQAIDSREFSFRQLAPAGIEAVTVYFWNDSTRSDGVASAIIESAEPNRAASGPQR